MVVQKVIKLQRFSKELIDLTEIPKISLFNRLHPETTIHLQKKVPIHGHHHFTQLLQKNALLSQFLLVLGLMFIFIGK